jgi:hypothetical protein
MPDEENASVNRRSPQEQTNAQRKSAALAAAQQGVKNAANGSQAEKEAAATALRNAENLPD